MQQRARTAVENNSAMHEGKASVEGLERQLDSFVREERDAALAELVRRWRAGEVPAGKVPAGKVRAGKVRAGKVPAGEAPVCKVPAGEAPVCKVIASQTPAAGPGSFVNLHIHSFHSYNAYGYSPSKAGWLARRHGLAAAGIMDFDVLDGLEEFFAAAERLDLKACVGMETRVFIPEFADVVTNSPGEPGVAYHMGYGFATSALRPDLEAYRRRLQDTSQARNREIIGLVNPYLAPAELDFERDVVPLTPGGNVTERHICKAYALKGEQVFADRSGRMRFWEGKLTAPAGKIAALDVYGLESLIRSKTMKSGGVGYVKADRGSFPKMADFDRFVIEAGGVPVLAWLDGMSEGERRFEELCRIAMAGGVEALSCIPDLRYASRKGAEREKLRNMYELFELAERLELPMVAGTEMNIPGQRFVDEFESKDLAPLVPYLLRSAHIFYAHTVLQRSCGLGYTSAWAREQFADRAAKNAFFRELGETLEAGRESLLKGLPADIAPDRILKMIGKGRR